jgi:hypothetical protein
VEAWQVLAGEEIHALRNEVREREVGAQLGSVKLRQICRSQSLEGASAAQPSSAVTFIGPPRAHSAKASSQLRPNSSRVVRYLLRARSLDA